MGVWILFGSYRGKQLLKRCHAELETERAIAIVGVEPIVAGFQHHSGGDEYGLVSRATDLEEYLVLTLKLNLFVVEPARQIHGAKHLEHLFGREAWDFAARGFIALPWPRQWLRGAAWLCGSPG